MVATLFGELTADAKRIVLLGAGDDYELNQIAVRLDSITPHWTSALDEHGQKTGAVTIPATWPAVVQLGYSFNGNGSGAWVPQPRLLSWIAEETARRVLTPPAIPRCWPDHLTPRDYQLEDAAALAVAGNGFLLHDPGLGKTVIALLALEARRRAGHDIFPMVIVVPSWEVGDVWDTHIREWMPGWPEPVLHKGTRRARVANWKHGRYILITTYATARRDAKDMRDLLPKLRAASVVADEAHLIRNDKADQTQAVWRIARHAVSTLMASGTLVAHNMGDVYAPLYVSDPDSWPSKGRLKDRYLATRKGSYEYDTVTGLRPEMEDEFFSCLRGQLIRRAKADVLKQLPPKIYSVRRPEMPPEWRHAYDTMEQQMLAELPDGGELPVMSILAQLTRLSQLASSATDVQVTYEPDEQTGLMVPHYHVSLKRPCWKADSLLDLMGERPDQPTAVFAESRQLAMLTGEYCHEAGLRVGYVTGVGAGNQYSGGITQATRKNAVADFQDGKLDVIMCTAGAGGVGITLTASNCMVMMQRSYQLDLALQPEDRGHRIGSEIHEHIEVVDLVTLDTIDQRRREILRGKAGQLGQLVKDPRFVRELLGGLN